MSLADMDVDTVGGAGQDDSKQAAIHPLAIVHMSDQYTRITCGGSPLAKDSPVVGLLFGLFSDEGVLQIMDADDIPISIDSMSEATTKQVELHTAVFPQHVVVGWYRVSTEDEPTEDDLKMTQHLQQQFDSEHKMLFCQLQIVDRKLPADGMPSLDQDLPINLYRVHATDSNSSFLLCIPHRQWQLNTSESERIAVEKVIQEQQEQRPTKSSSGGESSSRYTNGTESIKASLQAMNARLEVLVQYLRDVRAGSQPVDHALLRQVQGWCVH